MGLGADIILDPDDLEKSFAPGRNFVTKLWNIGRFLLTNVGTTPVQPLAEIDPERLTRADRGFSRGSTRRSRECDAALGPARPDGEHVDGWPSARRACGSTSTRRRRAASCGTSSPTGTSRRSRRGSPTPGDDREVARAVLVHVFDGALRLLHPIVPFVTEALWQRLPGRADDELLVAARVAECRRAATIAARPSSSWCATP